MGRLMAAVAAKQEVWPGWPTSVESSAGMCKDPDVQRGNFYDIGDEHVTREHAAARPRRPDQPTA
eukprot:gene15098-11800_t